MKAYLFPGQGAQFPGMGFDLYEKSALARELFESANQILGFKITDIMFEGTLESLKQTRVTQPAIFLHSVILAKVLKLDFKSQVVAGHSLGEFSALACNSALSFEDGLRLVFKRAMAMQKACDERPSSMAAILGLEDDAVRDVCDTVDGIVVPANYNCVGQLVISGEVEAVKKACKLSLDKGAKRAIVLPVGGAFHSPLMESAREELAVAIENTVFKEPVCSVYQNVTANAVSNSSEIKQNLISQLTAPVLWTQTIKQMIDQGVREFTEIGPGKVLQGLVKKIDRNALTTDGNSLFEN